MSANGYFVRETRSPKFEQTLRLGLNRRLLHSQPCDQAIIYLRRFDPKAYQAAGAPGLTDRSPTLERFAHVRSDEQVARKQRLIYNRAN